MQCYSYPVCPFLSFYPYLCPPSQAIKEFSKSKLRKKDRANLFRLGRGRRGPEAPSAQSSPLDMIRGEIAILKKLNHENIVKLYEVLDVTSEDSMFMGKGKNRDGGLLKERVGLLGLHTHAS